MRLTSVVLPLPVPPMIAVVRPGRAVRLMSCSTGCSAPGKRNSTFRSSSRPGSGPAGSGLTGAATPGSVSMTSMIRSALTSARGTSMNMNVAIITDVRIWAR